MDDVVFAPLYGGGGGVSFATNGSYDVAGQWVEGGLDSLQVGGQHYKYEKVSTPGVNGQGTKGFGLRGTRHSLKVVYVAESEDAVISAWNADSDGLGAAPSTLTLGEVTYVCIFDGSSSKLGKCKDSPVSGLVYATADLVFESVR